MGAVLHDHIDVGLGSDDIVTPNNVVMFQVTMDFYFPIEQLKARAAEIFEFYDFDGISLEFFSILNSFIDFATVSTTQLLIKEQSVATNLLSLS